MGFKERFALYQCMERERERPLVVFVTSPRPQAEGQIAGDVVADFIDQIMTIPAHEKKVDLLVVSNGGDATVAWRIVSLLRERFEHLAVLVPQAAFSAATLLALGADEIVLHPNGNLGPTDPQIEGVRRGEKGQQERTRFAAEDLASFLRFAREEVGLTDQEHLRALFASFCCEIGHVTVGVAARAVDLSTTLGKRLLGLHMTKPEDEPQIERIVEMLNKKYFMHGYPVGRSEASALGLPVGDASDEVYRLMWRIWTDIEHELEVRKAFIPLGEACKVPEIAKVLFAPVPQLAAPAGVNVPLSVGTQQVPTAELCLTKVLLESTRTASRYVSRGKIAACRMPDLQFKISVAFTAHGWERLDIKPDGTQNPVGGEERSEGGIGGDTDASGTGGSEAGLAAHNDVQQ